MGVRTLVLGAMLVIAGAGGAAATSWKTYEYPADQFAVESPSELSFDNVPMPDASILSRRYYHAWVGTAVFSVDVARYVAAPNPTEQAVRAMIDAMAARGACRILSEQEVSRPAARAREVTMANCRSEPDMIRTVDLYFVGDRIYVVMVASDQIGNSIYGELFLRSFRPLAR
jgi:hypothetical protein